NNDSYIELYNNFSSFGSSNKLGLTLYKYDTTDGYIIFKGTYKANANTWFRLLDSGHTIITSTGVIK
ncbi:MAG: hypothetical protein IK094_00595, partial [Treponema sp.]|nr:hypothetical protein [Treponema sp.]